MTNDNTLADLYRKKADLSPEWSMELIAIEIDYFDMEELENSNKEVSTFINIAEIKEFTKFIRIPPGYVFCSFRNSETKELKYVFLETIIDISTEELTYTSQPLQEVK